MGGGGIEIDTVSQYLMEKQKEKSICKIQIDQKEKGFGFLCRIPNLNNKILITDISSIDETINNNLKFEIILNDTNPKEISFSKILSRVYYKDKDTNIIVIEIKGIDLIDEDQFLELDSNILTNDPNNIYKKKEIYFLPYKIKKKIFPTGIINYIEKDFRIKHNSNDFDGGQFSFPILLIENRKVIGFKNLCY